MQVCGLMDCVWRKMCVTLNIKLKNYIYVFSIYVGLCLSACNYFSFHFLFYSELIQFFHLHTSHATPNKAYKLNLSMFLSGTPLTFRTKMRVLVKVTDASQRADHNGQFSNKHSIFFCPVKQFHHFLIMFPKDIHWPCDGQP